MKSARFHDSEHLLPGTAAVGPAATTHLRFGGKPHLRIAQPRYLLQQLTHEIADLFAGNNVKINVAVFYAGEGIPGTPDFEKKLLHNFLCLFQRGKAPAHNYPVCRHSGKKVCGKQLRRLSIPIAAALLHAQR